jgi:hypothetical protein
MPLPTRHQLDPPLKNSVIFSGAANLHILPDLGASVIMQGLELREMQVKCQASSELRIKNQILQSSETWDYTKEDVSFAFYKEEDVYIPLKKERRSLSCSLNLQPPFSLHTRIRFPHK